MTTGTNARLNRIGTGDRYVIVPMDHGITLGAVKGLKRIEETIDAVTRGGADSVLTQKGLAKRVHPNKNGAGYIIHLNGSTVSGPDTNDKRITGTAKAALRLGADAVSVHINVGSNHEPKQIEDLARITENAREFGLPVLAMTYARGPDVDEHASEALGHAVRLGEELGADIVKTAYTGDRESYEHVVESTSLPVVIAGGKPDSDRESLAAVRGAIDAGAAGVSMGRTIFQHEDPEAITRAVSGIVHEDLGADEALRKAGLAVEA